MDGVDVSTYQGEIHFNELAQAGCDFMFAKATEGLNTTDDRYGFNHNEAKRVGIPFGAYHFLHFGEDPIAQAQHFLKIINGYEGPLLPMVDVEAGGQDGVKNLSTLITCISLFTKEVEKTLNGKKCIIYSDYGDWSGMMQGTDAFAGHPFWVAEYNLDTAPTLPNGFTEWVLWQWTSGGTVPGITGAVDRDRLNGNDLSVISR